MNERITSEDWVVAELCGEDRIPYFTQDAWYDNKTGLPKGIRIRSCYFSNDQPFRSEIAAIIDSLFPKSYRATWEGFSNTPVSYVKVEAVLTPNDVVDAYNEAGMTRYQKAARKIEAAGYELRWVTRYENDRHVTAYKTYGDFMAATIDKHGN